MSITTRADVLSASTAYPFATASTTFAACTWTGHCLGAPCSTYNDCDNDWICSNKVCSPCCETLSTSSATASPSLTQSQPASKGSLNTAATIGIGVGAVVLVVTCMAVGFWVCHGRRKRRILAEAPDTQCTELESDGTDHSAAHGERKRLFRTTAAELPCSAAPTELSSVGLVELEGSSSPKKSQHDGEDTGADFNDAKTDCFLPHHGQGATLRSRQARFEEYALSPGCPTSPQWTFSPITPEEQLYPPLSETNTISDYNPHCRTNSSEKDALSGGPYRSLQNENPAPSHMSHLRPDQTRTVAPEISKHASSTMPPNPTQRCKQHRLLHSQT